MAQKLILTNGAQSKAINNSWDFVEAMADMPQGEAGELYARVAAVFTAVNKSARAVANMPFALVDKSGEDYDTSDKWENKVGFLPNPYDLFRRVRQALIMNNKAYARMGKNVAGIPKQLHFVIPTSIAPVTDPITGDLLKLDRYVGGRVVQSYDPDSSDLVRWWWLDETTELLPSANTEFRALTNAAGILYYSDFFVKSFYQRGGIKPTLIAMKGLIQNEKKEEMERGWSNFVKGIGRKSREVVAKVFNAEAMDIKSFGDGLGDLKDTPVYRQALENIAIALDMPLALLLSNSANYATAEVEKSQWFDNVNSWCKFIAEGLNTQLFADMGLRLEFRPEVDAEQEDETSRTSALSAFGDALTKYPNAETFLAAMTMLGFEFSDELKVAVEKYFKDKEARAKELEQQTQQQLVEVKPGEPKPVEGKPEFITTEQLKPQPPKALSVEELNELRVWQEVAMRKLKKGECLEFNYQPHYGGMSEATKAFIVDRLPGCKDAVEIKALFAEVQNTGGEVRSETLVLADALNKYADVIMQTAKVEKG